MMRQHSSKPNRPEVINSRRKDAPTCFTPLRQLEQRMDEIFAQEGMSVTGLLILIRGLPGSGKTRLANQLKSRHSAVTRVFSVDKHLSRWRQGTCLSPDSAMLVDANAACKQAAWHAMRTGVRFIIIDNDNLKYSDLLPYVNEAIKTNYEVHFVEPKPCAPHELIKRNRRGLNEEQIHCLLSEFETYLSASEYVETLRGRNKPESRAPKLQLAPLTPDPSLEVAPLKPPGKKPGDECLTIPEDPTAKILRSFGLGQSEQAIEEPSNAPKKVQFDALAQLQEAFPNLEQSYLTELLEWTLGNYEYAAAIAADACESALANSREASKVVTASARNSSTTSETREGSSSPHDVLAQSVDKLSLYGSEPSQPRLSSRFIEQLYRRYAGELSLPKISPETEEMLCEQFDYWEPDHELGKRVLLGFLKSVGFFNDSSKSRRKNRRRGKTRNSNACEKKLENPNFSEFEGILMEESAIQSSIKDQEVIFREARNRKALEELVIAHPGTDREVIMGVLIRCNMDVDAARACMVAGILDSTAFQAAADTSYFGASTSRESAPSSPSSHGDSVHESQLCGDSRPVPHLSNIIREDEAYQRSLVNKSKEKVTMSGRLQLKMLCENFPNFISSHLSELLVQFNGDASKVRSFIEKHGQRATSQPSSLNKSATMDGKEHWDASFIHPQEAAKRLSALQAEISQTREELQKVKASMAATSEPLARCYYSEQLGAIRERLNDQLDEQSWLLVSVTSQKHTEEGQPQGSAQDPEWRTRQWLGYLDLHGLDQPRAMEALRQRIRLLQTGCVEAGSMPLPPEVVNLGRINDRSMSLPASCLPSRLRVITGWGAGSLPQNQGTNGSRRRKATSVLRSSVLNYLRMHKFDFVESPVDGVGCFDVRIGSGQRRQ